MLCLSGLAGYIDEPFNPNRLPSWCSPSMPYWFMYVNSENEDRFVDAVEGVVRFAYPVRDNLGYVRSPRAAALYARDCTAAVAHRVRGVRPLLKDPIALFSSEWICERFGAKVVVMIRHPAAFVSSIKRLNWRFHFRGWLEQPLLLRDWLGAFHADMSRFSGDDADVIDQAIVMWNAMHHVIARLRERHPEWIFVRHEDLARDPGGGFSNLYERLDLGWDERTADKVLRYSRPTKPSEVPRWQHASVRRDSAGTVRTWRSRLSSAEIARVRASTSEIASQFYGEEDWEV